MLGTYHDVQIWRDDDEKHRRMEEEKTTASVSKRSRVKSGHGLCRTRFEQALWGFLGWLASAGDMVEPQRMSRGSPRAWARSAAAAVFEERVQE
jgi:hypothetical protein